MKKLAIVILAFLSFSCSKTGTPVSTGESTDPPQYGTPYQKVPVGKDAIIYQVNIRAFSSDGNLNGIQGRLDKIKELGVNVIYLMPINPVGTVKSVNSPYSIKDYKSVGTEYGSLSDLQKLIEAAHSRDMAVILDFVANHTAWDHVWINNKSWYKQDGSGNIIHPPGTNFLDVAQLDFSNVAMKNAMIDAMRYWILAANADGYRCDFADNVPFSFWKEAISSLRSISGRKILMLAEGTRNDHFKAGFDLSFGMAFYSKLKAVYQQGNGATTINDLNNVEYVNATDNAAVVRYISNHDVNLSDGTSLDLFHGEKGSVGAFIIAAYMKGVPMIYNAQEIGYPTRITYFDKTPINWFSNSGMTDTYAKILGFRKASKALRDGQLFTYSTNDVVIFQRKLVDESVFVAVNTRNNSTDVTIPGALQNTTWIDVISNEQKTLGTSLSLPANDYLILKSK